MCIGKELLSLGKWVKIEEDVYRANNAMLFFIDDLHIYHDNVDREIEKWGRAETVVFASRHSSKSGRRTLSVHPVGNFGEAKFGGKNRELAPSSPLLMRNALKLLKEKAEGIDYDVCYEVTHHGPYLSTPAFFIETGSTEREWNDRKACRVIAETIMEIKGEKCEVALGIGGGHYAPRFTDIALKRNVAFGHMIADYRLDAIDGEMIIRAIDATPGVKYAYLHGAKGLQYKSIFESRGIECVVK